MTFITYFLYIAARWRVVHASQCTGSNYTFCNTNREKHFNIVYYSAHIAFVLKESQLATYAIFQISIFV